MSSKNHHTPKSNKPIYCKKCGEYTEFYNKEIWFKEHYMKLHNPMKKEEIKRKNNPASHFTKTNENYKKGIFPENWLEKKIAGHKKADELITEEMNNLEKEGFRIIPIGRNHDPKPDVIAIKDGKVYAIEVESSKPDYDKYCENKLYYDDIIWILKKKHT